MVEELDRINERVAAHRAAWVKQMREQGAIALQEINRELISRGNEPGSFSDIPEGFSVFKSGYPKVSLIATRSSRGSFIDIEITSQKDQDSSPQTENMEFELGSQQGHGFLHLNGQFSYVRNAFREIFAYALGTGPRPRETKPPD